MMRLAMSVVMAVAVSFALTWVNTGDLAGAKKVRDLSTGPGGRLYAAAYLDTGPATFTSKVYRSTDFFNWDTSGPLPGALEQINCLMKSSGDTLFAGTRSTYSGAFGGWLYFSANGDSWTARSRISGTGMGDAITTLLQDGLGRLQTGNNWQGMATVRPYFSTDRGATWTAATTVPYSADIWSMLSTSTGALWFGSTYGSQLRRSTDNGVNWVSASVGMSGNAKSALAESPAGTLFAGSRSTPSSGWIYRSTDAGANWSQVYTTTSAMIQSLCWASDGNLYAGTVTSAPSAEVLVSTDNGTSWTSAGAPANATSVLRLLDVNVSGTHYLYAATGPNGDVFRAALSGVTTHDVGVTRILAPTGPVDSGSSVIPACSVYNYGSTAESYTVRMKVGATYNLTANVSSHAPGPAYVTFPAWTATQRGWNNVRCSTELAGDANQANDRRIDSVNVVVHDVAATAIVSPGAAEPPGTVTPAASVRNLGTAREPTKIFFSISPGGYADSVVLNSGLPFADTTVSFSNWNAVPGSYSARCSVYSVADQVRANDTTSIAFSVSMVDAGVVRIVAPVDTIDTLVTVGPSAVVANFGAAAATFRVFFRISRAGTVYADSLTVTGLASGDSTAATFRGWAGPRALGEYTTRCSLYLAGDANARNDVLDGGFTVAAAARPPAGWVEKGPVPMPVSGKQVKDGGWLAFSPTDGRVYAAKGNKTGDFYAYVPWQDSWKTLAAVPAGMSGKLPGKGAAGCSDGGSLLYATKGNNTQEFYRYDITKDSWRALAVVPLGTSNKKVKGGTDLAYVPASADGPAAVYLLKGYRNEFWSYSPDRDSWASLPDLPAAAWAAGSWLAVADEKVYAHQAKYHGFYAYDPSAGAWSTALTGMPYVGRSQKSKKSKDGGSAALLGSYFYAFKGGNTQEFWRYAPATDSWREMDTIPQYGSTLKKKKVKAGGDLAATLDRIYALKGNKTLEFWQYGPSAVGRTPDAEQRGDVMAGASAPGGWTISVVPSLLRDGFLTVTLREVDNRWSVGRTRISIYDAGGRLIRQSTLAPGLMAVLDVRTLASGAYVMLATDGLQSGSTRFVVER